MLLMGLQLIGKSVMSLRTGGPIGTALSAIVNPSNLKIEGWFVNDAMQRQQRVLLSQDVRDIIAQGFVVNDHEAMTDPAELVRLESLLHLKFDLIGKSVVTEGKKHLGKVKDYAFEKDTFFIQKLYTEQSVIRSLSGSSALVDRTNIVEINDRKIVVSEATVPAKVTTTNQASQPAMNPAQS
jgi:uncharacterized protein YrrD